MLGITIGCFSLSAVRVIEEDQGLCSILNMHAKMRFCLQTFRRAARVLRRGRGDILSKQGICLENFEIEVILISRDVDVAQRMK